MHGLFNSALQALQSLGRRWGGGVIDGAFGLALPDDDRFTVKRMTEQEWNECSEPQLMLQFLRNSGRLTERKERLVAQMCCVWWLKEKWRECQGDYPLLLDHPQVAQAMRVHDQYVDRLVAPEDVQAAMDSVWRSEDPDLPIWAKWNVIATLRGDAAYWFRKSLNTARSAREEAMRDEAELRRDYEARSHQVGLLRDLFGPLPFRPVLLESAVLPLAVQALAETAYAERTLPSGTLDPSRLSVLADAAEEAGVAQEVVAHLRSAGPHWRGCWAIDLLVGRR